MGCASSNDATTNKKGKKGKKGNKGMSKAKSKQLGKNKGRNNVDDDEDIDLDFQPLEVVNTDAKPEALKKEINKTFKAMVEKRDKLKVAMKPFLAERRGLNAMLDEEKEKLLALLDEKQKLEEERQTLMESTWQKDADEIRKYYDQKDKPGMIHIICNRTRWQLDAIAKVYEEKFGEVMHERLRQEGTGFFGGLTNLSMLLLFRIMPQDERDAAFLRDFTTKGMSIQDENILEVVLTRTNKQLAAALDCHADITGTPLRDILTKASYKNYRDFMIKVLECNRDERNEPFEDHIAQQLADELYNAGAGRTIGIDAAPFIRILSVASKAQIDSIMEKYGEKYQVNKVPRDFLKDIDSKLGGDFAMAVKIRCTDKYVYLASRLALGLKGFSKDKDLICRIIGSLSRPECAKLREAYDASKENGRSLEASLKAATASEPNFLRALVTLLSGDLSQSPLGSDKEFGEDEMGVAQAGNRARETAEEHYNRQEVFNKGIQLSRDNKIDDDDEIPNFELDVRCKSSDVVALQFGLKDLEKIKDSLDTFKEEVKDEIIATKQTYFAIHSANYESEVWIGTLRSHVSNLRLFDQKRDMETANAKKKSKGGG